MVASIILNNLLIAKTKMKMLPRALYIHADNTLKVGEAVLAKVSQALVWPVKMLLGKDGPCGGVDDRTTRPWVSCMQRMSIYRRPRPSGQ